MRTRLTSDGQAAGPQVVVLQLPIICHGRVPVLSSEISHATTGAVRSNMRSAQALNHHYRAETWTRGVPALRAAVPVATTTKPAPSCAKDLIAELQTINSQVHRMMSQVERAVANLALAG